MIDRSYNEMEKQRIRMKPNKALKLARTNAGWTREALADALGVSIMTIYRWERGENTPAPRLRRRVCELLHIPEQTLHWPPSPTEGRRVKDHRSPLFIDPCLPALSNPLVGQHVVLKELERSSASCRTMGITGLAGSGKTALALALTSLPMVHQGAGVFWATLGQHAQPLRHLHRWLRLLGEKDIPFSVEEAKDRLTILLRERPLLIILDDLWNAEDMLPYSFPSCHYIVTTRLPKVAHTVCDRVYCPRPLSEAQAFQLLKQLIAPTLARTHRDVLHALMQQVGNLPRALQHIGNYVRTEARSGSQRRVQEALTSLFQPEAYLHLQSAPDFCSLAASLQQSEAWLSSSTQHALDLIANALPTAPATFSEQQVANLFQTASEVHLQDLDHLVDMGLLSTIARNRYQLHPVVAAYARSRRGEEAIPSRSIRSWLRETSTLKDEQRVSNG